MRFAKLLLSALLLLGGLSATSQESHTFVTLQDKKQFYQLKGKGEPVVVFLTGAGVTMGEVSWFADSLAKLTTTLVYDRAGLGQSELINTDRSLVTLSQELMQLLNQLNLKNPVILVGHSRGALLARYFAKIHPQRVGGMLLIDPALPEWRFMRRAVRSDADKIKLDSLYNSYTADTSKIPLMVRQELLPNPPDSSLVSDIPLPKNMLVTILASVKPGDDEYGKADVEAKKKILKKLVKNRSNVKLVYTEKSGHFIYEDEPQLVLRELKALLYLTKMLPQRGVGLRVGY